MFQALDQASLRFESMGQACFQAKSCVLLVISMSSVTVVSELFSGFVSWRQSIPPSFAYAMDNSHAQFVASLVRQCLRNFEECWCCTDM